MNRKMAPRKAERHSGECDCQAPLSERTPGAQASVYGHSHRYSEQETDGRLLLNPGGCGRRRFSLELSMAVLWIDGGSFRLKKVALD